MLMVIAPIININTSKASAVEMEQNASVWGEIMKDFSKAKTDADYKALQKRCDSNMPNNLSNYSVEEMCVIALCYYSLYSYFETESNADNFFYAYYLANEENESKTKKFFSDLGIYEEVVLLSMRVALMKYSK